MMNPFAGPEWEQFGLLAEKAIATAAAKIGIKQLDDGPLKGAFMDVFIMGLAASSTLESPPSEDDAKLMTAGIEFQA